MFFLIVVPVLTVLFFGATFKSPADPSCAQCLDGVNVDRLPLEARRGLRVVLRCPGCGTRYRSRISQMYLKPLTEAEFRREFDKVS